MTTVAQQYARTPGSSGATPREGEGGAAPVVLMVSGGADSTALLVMACTSALDIADGRGAQRIARERLHVLHVNHHLRGAASDGDEEFVRALCAEHGLPLCVEHASFEQLNGQNLEAAAREVRYAAARRYARELSEQAGTPRAAARILTAHTASDRAETFFINAIKGAGPAGLSSIPRRRNIIVRPLIDKTHEELCRYLEVAGIAWREDESNEDLSYLRNFVRHRVLPVARERNEQLVSSIGATCDILSDEDAFMAKLAATAYRTCLRRRAEGLVVIDGARLASSEVAVARRIVRLAVKELDPDARLEMGHVEAVLGRVAAGSGSVSLPGGIDARMEFGTLTFRTPRAREEIACGWLAVPGAMGLSNGRTLSARIVAMPRGGDAAALARTASREEGVVLVAAEALGYAEGELEALARADGDARGGSSVRLWVDGFAPGDMMCPLGMDGRSKKVSDLLNECKVPVAERSQVPLVRTAPRGQVVWVAGIRLDERFKCGPATRYAVRLHLRRAL